MDVVALSVRNCFAVHHTLLILDLFAEIKYDTLVIYSTFTAETALTMARESTVFKVLHDPAFDFVSQ